MKASVVDNEEGAGVEPVALQVLNHLLQLHQLPSKAHIVKQHSLPIKRKSYFSRCANLVGFDLNYNFSSEYPLKS